MASGEQIASPEESTQPSPEEVTRVIRTLRTYLRDDSPHLERFRHYAEEILTEGMLDSPAVETWEQLSDDQRAAYIEEQAARMAPAMLEFALAWGVLHTEFLVDWIARQ